MTHLFPDAWCCCPCVYRLVLWPFFSQCVKVALKSRLSRVQISYCWWFTRPLHRSPASVDRVGAQPCRLGVPPSCLSSRTTPPLVKKELKKQRIWCSQLWLQLLLNDGEKKTQQFSCCSLEMFMSLLELAEFQARSRTGKEVGHRNRSFLLFAVAACEQDYTIVPDNVVPSNCVLGPWFDMVTTTFHKPTCERLWWLFKSKITCRAQRAL